MYGKATVVHKLVLCPATLLKLMTVSRNFLVIFRNILYISSFSVTRE